MFLRVCRAAMNVKVDTSNYNVCSNNICLPYELTTRSDKWNKLARVLRM